MRTGTTDADFLLGPVAQSEFVTCRIREDGASYNPAMSLPQSPPARTKTLYHEAAHAVLGLYYGVRCDCIRLKRVVNEFGETEGAAVRLTDWPTNIPKEDCAAVQYAGYAIQRLLGDDPTEALKNSDRDRLDFREMLKDWWGVKEEDMEATAVSLFRIASLKAKSMLEDSRFQSALIDLGNALVIADDNGEDYFAFPRITDIVSEHLSLRQSVLTPPVGDPCAESLQS